VRALLGLVAGALLALPAAAAGTPVVVLDPGHDLRANLRTRAMQEEFDTAAALARKLRR
jgi:hypothetical protein